MWFSVRDPNYKSVRDRWQTIERWHMRVITQKSNTYRDTTIIKKKFKWKYIADFNEMKTATFVCKCSYFFFSFLYSYFLLKLWRKTTIVYKSKYLIPSWFPKFRIIFEKIQRLSLTSTFSFSFKSIWTKYSIFNILYS